MNDPDLPVVWQRGSTGPLNWMRVWTAGQNVLGRKGDNVRIDWFGIYMVV